MTDIDPKSIPVLDDVIEDENNDQHVQLADEATDVEVDNLFSPSSLVDEETSRPISDTDHAASIAVLEGDGIGRDRDESNAADQTDGDTDDNTQPLSDIVDHTDAISALDEATPGYDDFSKDYPATDEADDDVVNESVTESESTSETGSAFAPNDTGQQSPSQQSEINTTAVTNQIIDRLMPEIEQRLRVIIDLTLRESLRDKGRED